MRRRFKQITEQTRDALLQWREAMRAEGGLSDEEAVERYVLQHKGKPDEILRYVRQTAPPDQDVVEAAIEYERTMEDQLKRFERRSD